MKKAWQKRCPDCKHQIFKLWASHEEWVCSCRCHKLGWELHRLDNARADTKAEMLRSIWRRFSRARSGVERIYQKKVAAAGRWSQKAIRRLEAKMAIAKRKVRNLKWKPTSTRGRHPKS